MITEVHIQNFKSIKSQSVPLGRLTILTGGTGSGKTNFIEFFNFLNSFRKGKLFQYVYKNGGADRVLFAGKNKDGILKFHIKAGQKYYLGVELISDGSQLNISGIRYFYKDTRGRSQTILDVCRPREMAPTSRSGPANFFPVNDLSGAKEENLEELSLYLNKIMVYQVGEAGPNAKSRQSWPIMDADFLYSEAENIAPYLKMLKREYPISFAAILETIREVYPCFRDFILEESEVAKETMTLQWREKGKNYVFCSSQMSSGMLHFICLCTLLLQPITDETPGTILLDNPEQHLSTQALAVLGRIIQKATEHRQIILATQSTDLMRFFSPEDILIWQRGKHGESVCRKLVSERLYS